MARGKQKTTLKLGRAEVTEVISAHVEGMFRNPVEVVEVEVHRDGSVDVTYAPKTSEPELPLGEDQQPAGQAKTGGE